MTKRSGTNLQTLLPLWLIFFFVMAVSAANVNARPWEDIVAEARGQTVDWFMWGGSPAVNAYVNGYLADQLKMQYGITLRQGPVKDISEVVSKLVIEKQAGKHSGGNVDLMWINGENFRTCKRNDLLYGPFADQLPNQLSLIHISEPTRPRRQSRVPSCA